MDGAKPGLLAGMSTRRGVAQEEHKRKQKTKKSIGFRFLQSGSPGVTHLGIPRFAPFSS